MSRKRDKQRESRRELARQLGVHPDDVPEELRSHARVCEPEVSLTLVLDRAQRGLLARALPTDVHVALFVVDAAGARMARALHVRGTGSRVPGEVPLAAVTPTRGDEKIRYTRPGHFFLVVLVTEGASPDEATGHAQALADPQRLIVHAGARRGRIVEVTAPELERPTSVTLAEAFNSGEQPVAAGKALRFVAATALRVPAAHRVDEEVELSLASGDARLAARARVRLRL